MAELHRHVLRFYTRACDVNHVEVLGQPYEIAEVGKVTGALAAVEVADGRGAAHRHGREMTTAERDRAFGRAADELKRRW